MVFDINNSGLYMKHRTTIYARVSTKYQHPENQITQLQKYADARDFNIVKVYQEKISSKKNIRPLFRQLLDDVRKRKTDVVLVWKLDRLARSTQELLNTLSEFNQLGVKLVSYTENIDTTTPAGKALFSMAAVFSEFENDIRSERIIAGMERAKISGKKIGRPGLSKIKAQEITEMKEAGKSLSEIIKLTGFSRNTIKKYLRLKRI